MPGTKEAWVTCVVEEQDVPDAVILCFSLRKVFTNRPTAVITTPTISTQLREVLNHAFDFVFHLEEDRNRADLALKDFAKVFALTLRSFEKCVFLSPSMLALKNCDELFDGDIPTRFMCAGKMEQLDTSICLIQPSLESFHALMGNNGQGLDKHLGDYWLKNQVGECMFLQEKYNRKISLKTGMLLGFEEEIRIVNFLEHPTELLKHTSKIEALGRLGMLVVNHWMNISVEVAPLLEDGIGLKQKVLATHQTGKYDKEPVAIIGMSCRYPRSNNLEEFWNLLANGGDGTGTPPSFRWLRNQCVRQCPNSSNTNAGFLQIPVDEFDSKFFGISPKEMVSMDPQQRLLLQLVWEALEDAAIDLQSVRGSHSGVFTGSWLTNYLDILKESRNNEFYRLYMGNSMGAAAARISFQLGLTGPSVATESGCSSAMVAVHLACKSLLLGETKLALVGGVNLILHPFNKDEMPMVISPEGHCKTFDASADGFARAEGCGVLVLKKLFDAIKDGDNIWALLRGSAMAQEGTSKSMGTPTIDCEALAMSNALKDAKVHPEEVSYIETHGTGTSIGDPLEVAAIAKAYHTEKRRESLIIGSVKTNVGHTESCSGITGIMKVVLSMHNQVIPPHRNFTTLNPAIDLEAVPAKIPLEPIPWVRSPGKSRIAGVSSFGITGTDAHVLIEEPPILVNRKILNMKLERPYHILRVSAKTEEALEGILEKYKEHLGNRDDSLEDVAYTANIGRGNFSWRAAIVAKSKEEALASISKQKFVKGEINGCKEGKVCFLFTGQGSQYSGMGRNLYDTSPVFRMHFDYCEQILNHKYNIKIKDVIWPTSTSTETDEISKTIFSQISIFCIEYALLKLWESWGVKPDFALGHSLGEFAAAVCAGIISVEDAITLVVERSRLIDKLPSGKMLVIRAAIAKVEAEMQKFAGGDPAKLLDYAAINSREQTVVAGDSTGVMQFGKFCKDAGLKCLVLEGTTHAFHSRHMDPILNEYKNIAESVETLGGNCCQYISGVRGVVVDSKDLDASYWIEHTREKVEFMKASKSALELGCTIFVEVGPHPILSGLTMANCEESHSITCLPTLKRDENEWKTLLRTLSKLYVSGVDIDWKGFDQFFARRKLRLPSYPFAAGKKFWPDLMSVSGTPIHPLLGSVIPNASSAKLFQCGLSSSSAEYMKDHVVGTHVIFPGAGYLEMCFAAGLGTVEASVDVLSRPNRPMKVENLVIQAPFCLEDSQTYQLQTVAEFNQSENGGTSWNDINIRIFHQVSESSSSKWLEHARATFAPVVSSEDSNIDFNVEHFLEKISAHQEDAQDCDHLYEELAGLGLKFGPAFRSLEKVWQDEDENNQTFFAKIKKVEEGTRISSGDYLIHPVLFDAMIQALVVCQRVKLRKKLHVPIKIGKCVWLSEPTSANVDFYVQAFAKKENETSSSVILVDGLGKIIASMSSVDFMETTVKAVESVLAQQLTPFPEMWEEEWRPQLGSLQNRLCLQENYRILTNFQVNPLNSSIEWPEDLKSVLDRVDKIAFYYILLGLHECGWNPVGNQVFQEDELLLELKIQKEFSQLFGFYMGLLEDHGLIKKEDESLNSWRLVREPPSPEFLKNSLDTSELGEDLQKELRCLVLYETAGKKLSKILQGKESAINVLFPSPSNNNSRNNEEVITISSFYEEYVPKVTFFDTWKLILSNLQQLVEETTSSSPKVEKKVIRILEVGAGSGAYSMNLIEILESLGIEYEYTYTDISSSFFASAEKKFSARLKHMKFAKLNIEEDPFSQGFTPEYFDLCFAAEVIHATRDILETMRNVRMLLKPYGVFYLWETTTITTHITFTMGLLEGYWRFQDKNLRRKSCTMTRQQWTSCFPSAGFQLGSVIPAGNPNHSLFAIFRTEISDLEVFPQIPRVKAWIHFHFEGSELSSGLRGKLEACSGRKVIVVEAGENYEQNEELTSFKIRMVKELDFQSVYKSLSKGPLAVEGLLYCWSLDQSKTRQEDVLRPYFYAVKNIPLLSQKTVRKLVAVTSGGMGSFEESDISYFHSSSIWGFTRSLGNERMDMLCKCIDLNAEDLPNRDEIIFTEIWSGSKDSLVSYDSRGTRYSPKFQRYKPVLKDLTIPPGTNRYQLILPETKVIGDLQFGPLAPFSLEENEIEVEVKVSALNFRDVFSVLKPTEQFKDTHAIGFDFAGVVRRVGLKVGKWVVGDAVFGMNAQNNALPSHVKLGEGNVVQVPPNMSLAEAATIPAVFMTAYHCLVNIANIRRGEVVLVHTASGGVGLAAIQICQNIGAEIVATAGSQRKRNYLKSLGIKNVFHSRNTDYGREILKITDNRGVDVVLNSLTSEGFKEASLKACAPGGRFVEMSKLSIWQPEEVRRLRPDVKYTIVDLASADEETVLSLMKNMEEFMRGSCFRPIPHLLFDGINIREALQYLQKGKHIGKIVCALPEVRLDNGEFKVVTLIFNDRSTYLITGGLGGIGFAVCKWMLEKGAKYVVLAGRSKPKQGIMEEIDQLNSKGAHVLPVRLDVGNIEECRELLLSKIPEMRLPPLRGVMHAAGIVADGLVENQEWETFSSNFQSKIDGTLNLHELTRKCNLEHFVLFSSTAALFGPPGQSNHSAATLFEDTFARYRHSVGLPATTVNWGQWGEVGVATELDFSGIRPLTTLQGLSALEHVLKSQRVQTCALNIELASMLPKYFPNCANYLDERLWKTASLPSSTQLITMKADEFWDKFKSQTDSESKYKFLKNELERIIKHTLQLDDGDTIQLDADFQDLGVDSLMLLEVKNLLQTMLGDRLSISADELRECNTLHLLSKKVFQLIQRGEGHHLPATLAQKTPTIMCEGNEI